MAGDASPSPERYYIETVDQSSGTGGNISGSLDIRKQLKSHDKLKKTAGVLKKSGASENSSKNNAVNLMERSSEVRKCDELHTLKMSGSQDEDIKLGNREQKRYAEKSPIIVIDESHDFLRSKVKVTKVSEKISRNSQLLVSESLRINNNYSRCTYNESSLPIVLSSVKDESEGESPALEVVPERMKVTGVNDVLESDVIEVFCDSQKLEMIPKLTSINILLLLQLLYRSSKVMLSWLKPAVVFVIQFY